MTARDDAQPDRVRRLLTAAQRGDPTAQAELFNAFKQPVARQIQRMTGDADVVDDLVQDVFIAAFSALSGFRGEAQLQTWLYTITANKVRNWWESQRRRKARERKALDGPADIVATPEENAEAEEHRRRLYAALGELPDNLREAFTARAIEGRSLQEASEFLGVPISTVSYRTRRAEAHYYYTSGFDDVDFIDVREPESIAQSGGNIIKGSKVIPLSELAKNLDKIDCKKDTVFICEGTFDGGECSAAPAAGRIVIDHKGCKAGHIKFLLEGFGGWEAAGYPVEAHARAG